MQGHTPNEHPMQTVADLMVTHLVTCHPDSSLLDGHQRMSEHHIRHLPIVDDQQQLVGLLTQKELLRELINIVNNRGTARLDYYESKVPVREVMRTDVPQIHPEMSLQDAGEYFMKSHHGCLSVTDGGKLVGILSSGDFVRLSLSLLPH